MHLVGFNTINLSRCTVTWMSNAVTSLSYWLCLNTLKPLGVPTAKNLEHYPQPKTWSIKVRESCRPIDWVSTFYPLSTESLIQVLSDNAGTPINSDVFSPGSNTAVLQQWVEKSLSQYSSKTGDFLNSTYFSWQDELKVVLTCTETTYGICCRVTWKHPYPSRHWFWDICWPDFFAHLSD